MNTFLFSLKHMLKTPLFWILTALVVILPPLLNTIGKNAGIPRTVYVLENPEDADSRRIAGYLEHEGFERFDDEETLRKGLYDGTIDAGLIVPGDLTNRLNHYDVEGVLRILFTPTTLLPDITREKVTAALFTVYAPYLTSKSLGETEITKEEVLNEYHRRMGDPSTLIFTFDFIEKSGAPIREDSIGKGFFLGGLALLLYLALYFAVALPLMDRFLTISKRIGKKAAFRSILIPGTLLRVLVLSAAAVLAALLSSEFSMIPAVLLYTAAVTVIHYLFLSLPGSNWKDVVILFVTAFSLVVCPVFLDLAIFFRPLRWIRFFLPPYHLWFFSGI